MSGTNLKHERRAGQEVTPEQIAELLETTAKLVREKAYLIQQLNNDRIHVSTYAIVIRKVDRQLMANCEQLFAEQSPLACYIQE